MLHVSPSVRPFPYGQNLVPAAVSVESGQRPETLPFLRAQGFRWTQGLSDTAMGMNQETLELRLRRLQSTTSTRPCKAAASNSTRVVTCGVNVILLHDHQGRNR